MRPSSGPEDVSPFGGEKFVPPSVDYAKRAARHLQRLLIVHKPSLKLHVAQHALARAYGFTGWHDLIKWMGRDGVRPSLLDEAVDSSVRRARNERAVAAIMVCAGLAKPLSANIADYAVLSGAPQSRKVDSQRRQTQAPPSDDGFMAWYRGARSRIGEMVVRICLVTTGSDVEKATALLNGAKAVDLFAAPNAAFHRRMGPKFIELAIEDHRAQVGERMAPTTYPLEAQQHLALLVLRDLLRPERSDTYDFLLRVAVMRAVHMWKAYEADATNATDRAVYGFFKTLAATLIGGTRDEAAKLLTQAHERALPASHNRIVGETTESDQRSTLYMRFASKILLDIVGMFVEFPYFEAMQAEGSSSWDWVERIPSRRANDPGDLVGPDEEETTENPIKHRVDELHKELDWWNTMQAFIAKRYGVSAEDEAWALYTADASPAARGYSRRDSMGFTAWMSHIWRPSSSNKSPVAEWLETDGKDCDPLWRDVCVASLATPFSIFQSVSSESGISVRLTDLLRRTTLDVLDAKAALSLKPGLLVYAQVINVRGVWMFAGCEPQPIHGRLFQQVLALRNRLGKRATTLAGDRPVRTLWFHLMDEQLEPPILRVVDPDGKEHVLDEAMMQTIAGQAGPEIEQAQREHEYLMGLPGMQAAISGLFAGHYKKWLDDSIPALGGRTPRAAAKTAEGRRTLEALIASFSGSPGMSAEVQTMLRRELGLGN